MSEPRWLASEDFSHRKFYTLYSTNIDHPLGGNAWENLAYIFKVLTRDGYEEEHDPVKGRKKITPMEFL